MVEVMCHRGQLVLGRRRLTINSRNRDVVDYFVFVTFEKSCLQIDCVGIYRVAQPLSSIII